MAPENDDQAHDQAELQRAEFARDNQNKEMISTFTQDLKQQTWENVEAYKARIERAVENAQQKAQDEQPDLNQKIDNSPKMS
jgi:gas vesicle protein